MSLSQGSENSEWFVQNGEQPFGPFTYLGLVQALQERAVYEFDFVWTEGMSEWVRLADLEAFSSENIRKLYAQKNDHDVFSRRRYVRIPMAAEAMIHDNRKVWMGHLIEGSEGGFGLVIENAQLIPGQTVMLHVSPCEGLPAFNAVCEIVGKRFTRGLTDIHAPVPYGVRVVQFEASTEGKIQEFFRTKHLAIQGGRNG